MGALTNALIVVMCINVALFMGEISMEGINPSHPTMFDCSESQLMSDAEANACHGSNYSLKQDSDAAKDKLPEGVTSGGITQLFFDIFNTAKGWITNAVQGFLYFADMLFAPMHFLSRIFPPTMGAYAYALGFLWYGITLFLFINWIKGGDA